MVEGRRVPLHTKRVLSSPRPIGHDWVYPSAVALDIAREYGAADLDENDEWVAGDVSRPECG